MTHESDRLRSVNKSDVCMYKKCGLEMWVSGAYHQVFCTHTDLV